MGDPHANDNIAVATPLYIGKCGHEQKKKNTGKTCYLNAAYSYRRCFNIVFVRKEKNECTPSHVIAFHEHIYTTNNP